MGSKWLLLSLLAMRVVSYQLRDSVVFEKISEVGISKNKWLVSLVLDLSVYDKLFLDSLSYINNAYKTTRVALARSFIVTTKSKKGYNNLEYLARFNSLQGQIRHFNKTRKRFEDVYFDYRSLGKRQRRSLIPAVGSLASFLFGVSDEDDLNEVRRAIKKLNQNDQHISHVVEKSLTIINDNRKEVKLNRDRIQALNDGIDNVLSSLGETLVLVNSTALALEEIHKFLGLYTQLEEVVDSTNELLLEVVEYLSDLRMQIDTIVSGTLTPSVVKPNKFRSILNRIRKSLNSNLRLPADPNFELWVFYKLVKCSAVFEMDRILIILEIPLIAHSDEMEIYKVYSLPVPNQNIHAFALSNGLKGNEIPSEKKKYLVAEYKVESSVMAIDQARERYSLMSSEEATQCLARSGEFCQFASPIYPVNIPRHCVIALFMRITNHISELCTILVRPNALLPIAKHISNGKWVVSTLVPMRMQITCDRKSGVSRVNIKLINPPLDVVELEQSCTATSNSAFKLPGYYEYKSFGNVNEEISISFENKTFEIWEPLNQAFPKINSSWNLKPLGNIDEIDMSSLIDEIKKVNGVDVEPENVFLKYLIYVLIIVAVVLCSVLMFWMIRRREVCSHFQFRPGSDRAIEKSPQFELSSQTDHPTDDELQPVPRSSTHVRFTLPTIEEEEY